MKKKKKKIETVRLITFDQAVIDVVGGTVLRREILENFIVANNEMMTVVGGNSLLRLGKNLAAGSYVLQAAMNSVMDIEDVKKKEIMVQQIELMLKAAAI